MCSIGGFVSSRALTPHQAQTLCSALLWYGQDRGSQSSGVYANGVVAKRALSPAEFIETPEFYSVFRKPVSIALTHTRQPTCGGRGDAQAQPFRVHDVVSVHNGMLWGTKELKAHWDILKKSGVDSELVTRFVASHGAARLAEFVASSDGPSAIAVLQAGEMYLLRDGNPIQAATVPLDDGNSVTVFGSEHGQVMSSLRRLWLMPPRILAASVKESVLLHVLPTGLEVLGQPLKRTSRYGRAWDVSSWDDARWQTWLAGQSRYKALPPAQSDTRQGESRKARKRLNRLRRAMEKGGELYLGEDTREGAA